MRTVLGGLVIGGSLVWAIVAAAADLWPGPMYREMQVLWTGGTYGLLSTFAVCWITTLLPVAVLGVLIVASLGLLEPRGQLPPGVTVPSYRVRRLAWTLGVGLPWGAAAVACFARPEVLEILGQGAILVLLWALIGFPITLVLAFDTVLPTRVIRGPIGSLEPGATTGDQKEPHDWQLTVKDELFHVTPEEAERLRYVEQVAVVATGMGNYLLAVAADGHPYRS